MSIERTPEQVEKFHEEMAAISKSMTRPTPTPGPSRREPWLWLQEHEASAEAEACDCLLEISGPNDEPGAAFYQCPLHAQAPALVEFVKFAITDEGATCYQHPSKPAFFIKRLDAITAQARAMLAEIEKG